MQVNFLSQIRLSHKGDGPKVAKRLIDVYFALFKVSVDFMSIVLFDILCTSRNINKSQFQVLVTEAGGSQTIVKTNKAEDRNISGPSKEGEVKNSLGTHIELDSRLLSALLTVSIYISLTYVKII